MYTTPLFLDRFARQGPDLGVLSNPVQFPKSLQVFTGFICDCHLQNTATWG